MASVTLRALVAMILMVGAAAAGVLGVPTGLLSQTRPRIDLEAAVPKAFGDWRVDASIVPIPPSPDQTATLNRIYDQVLSRTYVHRDGRRIMLSITYGSRQNQEMRAHRQEVCYRAQGFRVTDLTRLPLTVASRTVPAARMMASQGPRVEPVTYWFTMGDYAAMSYLDREMVQLRYALKGMIPDGYLVRLSNLSSDADASYRLHLQFADSLMAAVPQDLRTRLTGLN